MSKRTHPIWPNGHDFAFTIFDDTDGATVASTSPVYHLLNECGMRVTKTVWPVAPSRAQTVGGQTCADPSYLSWVRAIRADGHEIAYHHACDHSSTRQQTIEGLDRFRDLFGSDPTTGADHAGNRESLFAGSNRLSGGGKALYRVAERLQQPDRPRFSGDDPDSPYFWGDICAQRIKYWRGFTFAKTNILGSGQPFRDDQRPFVRAWFHAADAPRRESLLTRLAPDQVDDLERDKGLCILYAHLGVEYTHDGELHPGFAATIRSLSRRNGWFAPASEILGFLESAHGLVTLTPTQRRRMEAHWVVDRLASGAPLGPRSRRQTMAGP